MGLIPTVIALFLLMYLDKKYNYRKYFLSRLDSKIYYSIIIILYLGILGVYFAFTGIFPVLTSFGYAIHCSCAFLTFNIPNILVEKSKRE